MKPKSKSLAIIRSMPPKSHWPDKSQPFDVLGSEVAEWIISQPDIRQHLFNKARDRGLIVFDQDTGCWRGVDWKRRK